MKLDLPLTVTLPRKTKADKKFSLNLNIYRNLHHHTNNQLKVIYKGIVEAALFVALRCGTPQPKPPYKFTYTIFPNSKREFDLGNVCPIVQKFTDDALMELGVLEDDNYKIVNQIDYRFGGVDKENPRAELLIESVQP